MIPGIFWMWLQPFPLPCPSQRRKLRMKLCLSNWPLLPLQSLRSVLNRNLQLSPKLRIYWMISAPYKKPSECIQPMRDSIKETGIPATLLVKREHQTTHAGASIYLCPHEKCQTPPFYTQGLAAVYSHIRRKHLGLALACPYCANKVLWNLRGWKSHMDSKHSKVPHCGVPFMKRQLWLKRCYLPPNKLSPLMPLLQNKPAITKVGNPAPPKPRTVPETPSDGGDTSISGDEICTSNPDQTPDQSTRRGHSGRGHCLGHTSIRGGLNSSSHRYAGLPAPKW